MRRPSHVMSRRRSHRHPRYHHTHKRRDSHRRRRTHIRRRRAHIKRGGSSNNKSRKRVRWALGGGGIGVTIGTYGGTPYSQDALITNSKGITQRVDHLTPILQDSETEGLLDDDDI